MNSPYVGTDEAQRRWLSTVATNQSLDCTDALGAFGYSPIYYHTTGHPKIASDPSSNGPGTYDHCEYESEYQPQSTVAWSNSNSHLSSSPFHHESEYHGNCPSTWTLPDFGLRPTDASLASNNHEPLPLQTHAVLPLQVTQHPSHTNHDFVTPVAFEQTTFIAVSSDLSLGNAQSLAAPEALEEKVFDPPMVPYHDGAMPRQQSPRFIGDKYAASWIRGVGVERVGWCGFCPTWHRLKDSAYWYHVSQLPRVP